MSPLSDLPGAIAPDSSSASLYSELLYELRGAIGVQRDWLKNLVTTAELLAKRLPNLCGSGFYIWRDGRLELGPYKGKTTEGCVTHGFGVLGSIVSLRSPVLVSDFRALAGVVNKNSVTSKLALPLIAGDRLVGILNLDSDLPGCFDSTDLDGLMCVASLLVSATDWPEELSSPSTVATEVRY